MNSKSLESLRPFTFFFIKNEEGKCVGAVLDMNDDLHWVILKKYQGKGYLKKALKDVILPFICLTLERDEQRITISKNEIGELNYLKSKSVALAVGFSPIDINEKEFTLNLFQQDYTTKFIKEQNHKFEKDHLEKLQTKFLYHFKHLEMLSSELQMKFGDDMMLSEHLEQIRFFKYRIEDLRF